jgi:hypothetical protein
MGLQQQGLPAVATVAWAWLEASAQKRARSAPQRRTTPPHTDATPLQPPETGGLLSTKAVIRPKQQQAAVDIPY